MFRVVATLLATTTIAHCINWNGNWATSCDFPGNDLKNALSTGKDCADRCASTAGCTHYTWTNYNGGTCWMKKNSVSKNNAVPKYDQGAVCGVIVGSVDRAVTAVFNGAAEGLVTDTVAGVFIDGVANVSGTIASEINWNGNSWAAACQFIGNDLANAMTRAEDCGGRCAATPGCTHYTWTNYNSGTCWMKENSVSISDAIPVSDESALCGIALISEGGVITANLSGVITSEINWNGNNWAAACQFIGNDIANALTRAEDCGGRCAATPGCTHYTWTNYNGGTCWMKENSVSISDAIPVSDEDALCGIALISEGGVITANLSGVITSAINWNGNNWAVSCQFIGNDLSNALTRAKDCGERCVATPDCTHYTWTNYSGGTCWMKKNLVSKSDAVPRSDQGAVCGVVVKSEEGIITANVSGVIAAEINWNGNNWAASCQFIGNDLANALTRAKDCVGRCVATPGCTHYTWTNYNGGTCWMKKNSVSKSDAVPRSDQGAVCGVVVKSEVGVVSANVSEVIAAEINWNGNNWAASCQFVGNDLANALTRAKDCGGRCVATPGCTHYTWTNYNGGTCWMKKNSVSKNDAVPRSDQSAVCGVVVKSEVGVISANVNGVIAAEINWNGNNWAASCQFIGNDLSNALTRAKDCRGRCVATPGCTHYTWTNYNGGTCWMKKNSVSKGDAVPRSDQGAVCGVVVKSEVEVISANVNGVVASEIKWIGKNWAASCQFIGNDLANALTRAKDCGGRCAATPGCTHYTWTNYNGGTCWMKKNAVSKSDAVPKSDEGAVCGVNIGNAGGVGISENNWNGNSGGSLCDLFDNDVANVLTIAERCGWQCRSPLSCSHHACWTKKNSELSRFYFGRPVPYHNQIIINLV